jgi:transposase-like protein
VTQRNGHWDPLLTMAAGVLELMIPKLRSGSFFPRIAGAAPPDRSGAVSWW